MRKLLVIIPDRLSDLVNKGELTPRYYNPEDVFDEVHFLMTNDDKVDMSALGPAVGRASVFVHNIPASRRTFALTLGWSPLLLNVWAERGVRLARLIQPDLVRCHGVELNVYLALRIKKALGIPYVVSLHGNPDVDYFRGRLAQNFRSRYQGKRAEPIEIAGVKNADHVIAVYSPIVPYLEKHHVANYTLIYNSVGYGVEPKSDYSIHARLKCLSVGRQQSCQKDQTPIIDAIAELDDVELTLIGDGDLHQSLVARANKLGIADRVTFLTSLPNARILEEMSGADVYVYSSINYEISKTCIEAALAALPVVHNDRNGQPSQEIAAGQFILVAGDKDSYKTALLRLKNDQHLREEMGRKARAFAVKHWLPEDTERKTADIYRHTLKASVMGRSSRSKQ